jgi:hypothetical protein
MVKPGDGACHFCAGTSDECHMQAPFPPQLSAMLSCIGKLPTAIKQQTCRTLLKLNSVNRGIHYNATRTKSSPFNFRSQTRSTTLSNHTRSIPNGVITSWQTFISNTGRFIQTHHGLPHRAFIALGSNLGDRVAMIEQACKEVDANEHVRILRTSSLYETKAMYVLDQDNFVNGACEVDKPIAFWKHSLRKVGRNFTSAT